MKIVARGGRTGGLSGNSKKIYPASKRNGDLRSASKMHGFGKPSKKKQAMLTKPEPATSSKGLVQVVVYFLEGSMDTNPLKRWPREKGKKGRHGREG